MKNFNNFARAIQFTGKWEWGTGPDGAYTNDPDDPGGETKYGISKKAHPDLNIKELTSQQAANIYVEEYWDSLSLDNVPFPDCVAVFDTAVNCGVGRAGKWLRESEDIKDFIERRVQRYIDLIDKNPILRKYFKGWMNRVNDLKKYLEINASQDSA